MGCEQLRMVLLSAAHFKAAVRPGGLLSGAHFLSGSSGCPPAYLPLGSAWPCWKSPHIFFWACGHPCPGGAIVIDGTNPDVIFCAGLLFTAQFDAAVGAGAPAMRVVIRGTV